MGAGVVWIWQKAMRLEILSKMERIWKRSQNMEVQALG